MCGKAAKRDKENAHVNTQTHTERYIYAYKQKLYVIGVKTFAEYIYFKIKAILRITTQQSSLILIKKQKNHTNF